MTYQRGQEIMRCKPFTYTVCDNNVSSVCDNCLEENFYTLQKCTRCHVVYYCNKNCQKIAWENHHS